jgi:glyoxylase-like metal-dependent hydrolase (beta-lactamase superfamily II)
MLTGDVLFASGYVRTDFKYGSFSDMRRSLTKILALDGEITFYSGHGDSSKIKYER